MQNTDDKNIDNEKATNEEALDLLKGFGMPFKK